MACLFAIAVVQKINVWATRLWLYTVCLQVNTYVHIFTN